MGRNLSLSLSLFTPAWSELGSQMSAVARRSYFTFSLAVKKDEVITVLEWQLGSEVRDGSSTLYFTEAEIPVWATSRHRSLTAKLKKLCACMRAHVI